MARRNVLSISNLLNPEPTGRERLAISNLLNPESTGRERVAISNLINPEPTVNLYHGRIIKVKVFFDTRNLQETIILIILNLPLY